jgi:lactate dehydrogenase-like 2-hydroxyacid dehydrogenase
MEKRILITRPFYPDIIDHLRAHFDVSVNEGPRYTRPELHDALKDMDGAIIAGGEKVDEQVLNGLGRLKALCVSAAGYNNIDVDALTRAGIIGTNSPGPTDDTVADFAWGLMIATSRRLVEADRWVRQGNWNGTAGHLFYGANVCERTLGIIGMGRIGREVARRAIGFRMKVVYHNRRRLDPDTEKSLGATYLSKEELLAKADLVLLALPLSAASRHVIGAGELRLMRPGSMIFNVARGGLIDEKALAEALREKRIAAAGLDVFEGEPSIEPALLDMPNVVLTPHIAGATSEAQHGLARIAADNLIAILRTGPEAAVPGSIINPEVLKT